MSPSTGSIRIPAIIIPPLDYGNNLLTGLPASASSPMARSKQSSQSDPVKCKSVHVTSKGSPLKKKSLYSGLVASPPLSPTPHPHRLALSGPLALLSLVSWLWPCQPLCSSSNLLSTLLPQGLCTCCSLFLEYSSLRHLPGSFSYFFQVSAQMSPHQLRPSLGHSI